MPEQGDAEGVGMSEHKPSGEKWSDARGPYQLCAFCRQVWPCKYAEVAQLRADLAAVSRERDRFAESFEVQASIAREARADLAAAQGVIGNEIKRTNEAESRLAAALVRVGVLEATLRSVSLDNIVKPSCMFCGGWAYMGHFPHCLMNKVDEALSLPDPDAASLVAVARTGVACAAAESVYRTVRTEGERENALRRIHETNDRNIEAVVALPDAARAALGVT